MFDKRKSAGVISSILNEQLSKTGKTKVTLTVVQHTWSRTVTILFFAIELTSRNKPPKKGYFIVRKSNEHMIEIIEGN